MHFFFFFNLRYAHFPSSASVIAGAWRSIGLLIEPHIGVLAFFPLVANPQILGPEARMIDSI